MIWRFIFDADLQAKRSWRREDALKTAYESGYRLINWNGDILCVERVDGEFTAHVTSLTVNEIERW